jgi:hypothetical protein
VLLVAATAGGIYLAYELIIVPRRALQEQIVKLEQDKLAWFRNNNLLGVASQNGI